MGPHGRRGITLAEQAAQRVELARAIGAKPERWIATRVAIEQLVDDKASWSDDGHLFHGLLLVAGETRSEYGLDLVVAPR